MDQMALHLDRQIQRTLEALNKTPGKDKYNLIFAAAHGAPPEPDPSMRPQKAIFGETLARAIGHALSDRIDKGAVKNAYVDKYVYPFLYLKLETLQKQNTPLRGARKLAGEAALRLPGVAGYYTADGDCSHTGEWRQRFENSFHELRSGDVMLSYEPEAVEDFGAGRGISYGSLYNYDTRTPLFLYGPQFGSKLIERAIDVGGPGAHRGARRRHRRAIFRHRRSPGGSLRGRRRRARQMSRDDARLATSLVRHRRCATPCWRPLELSATASNSSGWWT